jgi:hypothetical protein
MTSVLNKPLTVCSIDPLTGYLRNGYCKNTDDDSGTHVVCAKMTDEFLNFTKSKGNNLSTPSENFPGLKSGDKWCLCALRWDEANKVNKAPPLDLNASDISALKFNTLDTYSKNTITNQRGGGKKKRKSLYKRKSKRYYTKKVYKSLR